MAPADTAKPPRGVIVIASEALIHAPAAKVWEVLTCFEDYPRWSRNIRAAGTLQVGEEVTFQIKYRRRGSDRWFGAPMLVEAVEPAQRLVCSFGLPALLTIQIVFALSRSEGRVLLLHEARISGLLAFVVPRRFDGLIRPVVTALTKDLQLKFNR